VCKNCLTYRNLLQRWIQADSGEDPHTHSDECRALEGDTDCILDEECDCGFVALRKETWDALR